jgi:2-dehydropantoate 2-reductase
MVSIMREVLAIGRAVGVDAAIDPEARIDMARSLGKFKTSMLQDLEAGKTLEIDGLLAGTLEIARKAGVKAPYTESLFALIKARAQATGQYSGQRP